MQASSLKEDFDISEPSDVLNESIEAIEFKRTNIKELQQNQAMLSKPLMTTEESDLPQ